MKPLFGTIAIALLLSLVAPPAAATDVVHACLPQTAEDCEGDVCVSVGEQTSCAVIDWPPCTIESGDICVNPVGECPVTRGPADDRKCIEAAPDLSGLDCWARVGFTEVARVCVRPDAACPIAFETAKGDRCAAA